MAVNQIPALTEPVNLVEPSNKRFYPLHIPLVHDQLRHFISVTEDNVIWYASKSKIYRIKNECRQLVTWVDFQIHCLAAAHGWICVGGSKDGRFAFRRQDLSSTTRGNLTSAVDEQLPLDLRSPARSTSPDGLRYLPHARHAQQQTPTSGGPRPIFYRSAGLDLVNAITIQKIVPSKSGAPPEVVALLANNDRTVTIFSLDQMRVIRTLHFETLMNHASLSTDGKLLIACGDTNKAYFFAGQELEPNRITGHVDFIWRAVASPKAACFPSADNCFSTAFSPDGKYCSIASQTGILALFDVGMIKEDMQGDAAVWRSLTTTRTGTHLAESRQLTWGGGVGCVAFSPRPQRLLAFAERNGRVLVVDLDFPRRPPQVIELFRDDSESVWAELSDSSSIEDIDNDEPSMVSQHLQRLGIDSRADANRRFAEMLAGERDLAARRVAAEHREFESRMVAERREFETRMTAHMVEDAANQRRLQDLLRRLRRDHSTSLEEPTRLLELISTELRTRFDPSSDNTGTSATSDLDLPPPPRRRSSIVLGTSNNAASTSSSHPSSLAPPPPPIISNNSVMSTSPSRFTSLAAWPSLSTSRSRNTSAVSPGDSQEAWNTISTAIASATHDSRRAALEQNLRNLRETSDTLQQASQLYRARARMNSSSAQALARPSQSMTEPATLDHTSRSRRSASVSRARQYLNDSGRRSTLEESIHVSHARLRMLENDLDQIDREHAAFTARTSRLWQDSRGSNSASNIAGNNASSNNNTNTDTAAGTGNVASSDVSFLPAVMSELLEASRLTANLGQRQRERETGSEWPDLLARETTGSGTAGDPGRFFYMPLTGDYARPRPSSHTEGESRSSGGGTEETIMGLAWNSNGSMLYVATTNGIYRLKAAQLFQRTFASASVPL